MVLLGEVSPEQADRGQAQRTGREQRQDARKAPARTSRLNAVAGGVFGQMQRLRAVAEE
jgi:hypothetical protein